MNGQACFALGPAGCFARGGNRAGLDLEKFRELNPPFFPSLPLHSEHYLSFVLFLATGWPTLMAMVWPAWEERQSDYDEMTLV
jgi:hypothetical protein